MTESLGDHWDSRALYRLEYLWYSVGCACISKRTGLSWQHPLGFLLTMMVSDPASDAAAMKTTCITLKVAAPWGFHGRKMQRGLRGRMCGM